MSYSASKANEKKDETMLPSVDQPKVPESTELSDLIGQIDDELELVQALQAANLEYGETDFNDKKPLFSQEDIYVRFGLNDIMCGFPLIHTLEITYFTDMIKLPNLPSWMLGVFNLKGEVITLIDLKKILNIFSGEVTRSKHILVIRYNNIKTGLIVDKVMGTYILDQEEKNSQSVNNLKGVDSPYISGTFKSEDATINIINMEKLFSTLESI